MSDLRSNSMRTPLKKVRALGSAKEGANHFWQQRMTAVANIVLVIFLIGLLASVAGADYATVRRTLANPLVALPLLLMILSGVYHMRLGMQVIIEDYVSAEGSKVALLMLNTFFAIFVGMACVYSVLKLSFGA
jgi:succinate dehydrogenase / fumarate reductase, membrane anchor subunit